MYIVFKMELLPHYFDYYRYQQRCRIFWKACQNGSQKNKTKKTTGFIWLIEGVYRECIWQ